MALFYQQLQSSFSTKDVIETEDATSLEGIEVHEEDPSPTEGPCIKYDFSKHVLIELLDNVTPEVKLWKEIGLVQNKEIAHKRLLVDPHRKNCRRAIVVCTSVNAAKDLAKRLTQSKIKNRCICAVVIQELLSDLHLFEKQIIQYGDKGSQQQLVYVTDLNRPREPASLARYLREKFSQFGTILSVFVSEGKDGYAFPEGVIRYAHLSEAFAAELAYDQCAVAMERLSVQTHHNILLSQCDLKTRLKEAKLQFSKEMDSRQSDSNAATLKVSTTALVNNRLNSNKSRVKSNSSSMTSEVSAHNSHRSDSGKLREKSNNSSVTSEVPLETNTRNVGQTDIKHASSAAMQDDFPADSAELNDVLKNSCNENLVDCLKCITMGSESSLSKQASTVAASSSEAQDLDQEMPHSSSPITGVGDRSWSSRIMGWITEIPSADDMARFNDAWGAHRHSDGSTDHQSPKESQNRDRQQPTDVVSNSGSFVTCKNGDITASYNSDPPSPASTVRFETDNLSDNWQPDRFSSPANSHIHPVDLDVENRGNLESIQLSLRSEDICPVSASQKRKNSSLMTQKLSVKTQRLDSSQALSEVSETETTIHLPSVSSARQCYVVLNSMPELNELARSFTFESTNAPEKFVSTQKSLLKSNIELSASSERLQHSSVLEACSSKSTRSLPVRRSSRHTNNSDNQKPSSVYGTKLSKKVKLLSSNVHGQENKLLDGKEESPLRLMLKNELKTSSANKDVSISVGCSHMTCDFCYPDSTKLLLECL